MGNIENGGFTFISEATKLCEFYPSLSIIEREGKSIITGELELIDNDGVLCDSYLIEIHDAEDYPFRFPHVFEMGGKIPINIDWHVYSDGHFCIKNLPEEIISCKSGMRLFEFIERELKPYLFNQTFRRLKGYFLKERSHGIEGELEFYYETFTTRDLSKIIKLLKFISKKEEPNRVAMCFCGSNIKYRKCHKNAYRLLSVLSDAEFYLLINKIEPPNLVRLGNQMIL